MLLLVPTVCPFHKVKGEYVVKPESTSYRHNDFHKRISSFYFYVKSPNINVSSFYNSFASFSYKIGKLFCLFYLIRYLFVVNVRVMLLS